MAVPRNRLSNARKNSKKAHHAKSPRPMKSCENCGKLCLPHHACSSCNTYAGHSLAKQK